MINSFWPYFTLVFALLHHGTVKAFHLEMPSFPSEITINAGFIPTESFGKFQRDLLGRIEDLARGDNITLKFEIRDLQELYGDNLVLLSPECHDGENRSINGEEYLCSDYDMIVGDFWPNPSRYDLVDFTPAWLTTAVSSMKFTAKTKRPDLDVTTLTEAERMGAGVCAQESSYVESVVKSAFPGVQIVPCGSTLDNECIDMLKNEECSLLVSDELILRRMQADTTDVVVTGERLDRQLLAWPVSRDLDPTVAFLLNKWIYASISSHIIDELYFEYFEKKLCPIGTAGKDCELPCDPDHGASNSYGVCICESTRWTGDDCSIEVKEDLNMIPPALKDIAYTMFAVNTFVILVCAIWLYMHRASSQVRFSQPIFLVLVLLGCLVSSSTILAMAQEDDGDGPVAACVAVPWLYSVGFSITFGTLFAKIRRVYVIFTQGHTSGASISGSSTNSPYRRSTATFKDTIFFIGAVLLLYVVVLTTWTIVDPLHWERDTVRVDQFGEPLESQGYCTSEYWRAFLGVLVSLNISLCAVASWMCYAARKIPTKYSEHKYVTISMISNLQIFLIGGECFLKDWHEATARSKSLRPNLFDIRLNPIPTSVPVLVIAGDNPATSFFVRCSVVWMNDLVVVLLIFGNLMRSVYKKSHDGLSTSEKADVERAVRSLSNDHVLSSSFRAPVDYRSNTAPSGREGRASPLECASIEEEIEDRGADAAPVHDGAELPKQPDFRSDRGKLSLSSLSQNSSSISARLSRSVSFEDIVYFSEISTSECEADDEGLPATRTRLEPLEANIPSITRRHSIDLPPSARWSSLSVSSADGKHAGLPNEEKRRSAPQLPSRPLSIAEPSNESDRESDQANPRLQKQQDDSLQMPSDEKSDNMQVWTKIGTPSTRSCNGDRLKVPERLPSIAELEVNEGDAGTMNEEGPTGQESMSSSTADRKEQAPLKPIRFASEYEDNSTNTTMDTSAELHLLQNDDDVPYATLLL